MSEECIPREKSREKPDFPFEYNHQNCKAQHEEKALTNYTNWLLERHAVHTKLLEKLQRVPGEFLMNYGDQLNQVKEEKAALEYTRIPQKFDRYRGNPEWWEPPPGLHERCTCRRDKLTYRYVKTKVQKNEIPEIEKVGTPFFIGNEKMVNPRVRSIYKKWQESDYRKRRVQELHSLLEKVEPHKPEFEKLVVVGKNTPPMDEETQTVPIVSLPGSDSSFHDAKKESSIYDLSLKCCLKINGSYFYENSPSLLTSHKFNVFFDYDVKSHPLQRKFLVFENVGRVTVRITWKKMEKFRIFRDFVHRKNSGYFCFDKNTLILVPGQIINLPVWFRFNKFKTVLEKWEITTQPKYWPDTTKVYFVFQAQTRIEKFEERIKKIKDRIKQKVKIRIIKEILEDLTLKTKCKDFEKNVDYSYYEPELFEAMNMDEKWPTSKYQYDPAVVEELKQFYSEVRLYFHPKTWNLKVKDLLVMARVKDIIEYAEDRTHEFARYRTMMVSKSTPVVGKESKASTLKTKTKASGLDETARKDSFAQKETKYGKLMKVLWSMAPPSITPNKDRLKYFQVYSILNAYFTQMSMELYEIKPFSPPKSLLPKKVSCNLPRLVFEEFDDIQMLRTSKSKGDDVAQPKPDVLKYVPTSDVQLLHKLYFAPQHPQKETKAKGDKEKKKGSPKADNKSTKGKQSRASLSPKPATDDLVNLNFNPYEEIPDASKETKDSTSKKIALRRASSVRDNANLMEDEEESVEEDNSELTVLNIYVAIYSSLCEAVDAVVDTLESAKEHRVPLEDIEQLKSCFELHIDAERSQEGEGEGEGEEEEEEEPLNKFENEEEREYFEKILSAHVNECTGKYLVCAKTEPFTKKTSVVEVPEPIVIKPYEPSVFSLFKREPSEIKYEEKGQQTMPFEVISDYDLLFTAKQRDCFDDCDCDTGKTEHSSLDPFYYSDDEVFGDGGQDRHDVSEDSDRITIALEGPKPVISLMDEWNKKKGSQSSQATSQI